MKSLSIILLTATFFIFTNCGSTKISSEKDSFTGGTTYSTDLLPIKQNAGPVEVTNPSVGTKSIQNPNSNFHLKAQRIEIPNKATRYQLRLHYEAEMAPKIVFGGPNSLLLNIDGRELSLSTNERSSETRQVGPGMIGPREVSHVNYSVSESVFRQIANGKLVKVRVITSSKNMDGFITDKLKVALKNLAGQSKTQFAD